MSFVLETVHGQGTGMSLTGITVAWMGSGRDGSSVADGTGRMAGCSPHWRGRVSLPARAGGNDALGKRQSMHLPVLPEHPLPAVPARCTCRQAALGAPSAEDLSPEGFPFAPVSIVPLPCPYGAAAYF